MPKPKRTRSARRLLTRSDLQALDHYARTGKGLTPELRTLASEHFNNWPKTGRPKTLLAQSYTEVLQSRGLG